MICIVLLWIVILIQKCIAIVNSNNHPCSLLNHLIRNSSAILSIQYIPLGILCPNCLRKLGTCPKQINHREHLGALYKADELKRKNGSERKEIECKIMFIVHNRTSLTRSFCAGNEQDGEFFFYFSGRF